MSRPVIGNAAARALFLDAHLLAEPPGGGAAGAALQSVIERLGFVQVDSVNTLARAHDLILWSRRPAYRPESLRWLNDRARGVFEHWTHDAAAIPVAFFPCWRLRFRRDRVRLAERWRRWRGPEFQGELDRVLAHVAEHGAVASGDLARGGPSRPAGWWDWHPSKTALEYLWRTGALAISRRRGFRKFYDLTERVIPPEYLNAHLPDGGVVDWACASALDRLGFAAPGEIAAFWALISPAEARGWVGTAVARGRVVEVDVRGADGAPRRAVTWPETLDRLRDPPIPPDRLRILSPFDPALRDRKRAERLFGFRYRIEMFVPEARRRFGYYVFPILQGGSLVGRIDARADRRAGRLAVRAVWPEPGVRWGKGRQARLEAELHRLTRLAGVGRVAFLDNWLRDPSDRA